MNLIDIDLIELDILISIRKFIENWFDVLARTTPIGIEINDASRAALDTTKIHF